jgi:non-homologous end joining protein Ku
MNLANYSDGYSKKVQELIDNMLKAGQVTEKTAED